MRLVRLSANDSRFKTVEFNRHGPTLILAKRKDPKSAKADRTYNGVGKSLLVYLVHFCLGAKANPQLEKKLPNWTFYLELEVGEAAYTIARSTDNQTKVHLNKTEMSVTKLNEFLSEEIFDLGTPRPFLRFRPLIKRFIRPNKESYAHFDKPDPKEKPYASMLATSYLLGLDVDLAQAKYELRAEKERIRKLEDNLKNDEIFLAFYTGNKNVEIELKELEDQISKLTTDLKHFKVAENYHELERSANDAQAKLQGLRNRVEVLNRAIDQINSSLKVNPDVPAEKVVRLFDEASVALPETVIKRLEEVEAFHRDLLKNRVDRLNREKRRIADEHGERLGEIEQLNKDLDGKFRFLAEHGAIEELLAIQSRVSQLQAASQKLRDYQSLLQEYKKRTHDINVNLLKNDEATNQYLAANKELLDQNLACFRDLAKRFYPGKASGLTIESNDGDNQIRYNINATIESDSSDGINEVKIFCFDLLLMRCRHRHAMNTIIHDSRLLSDMDPRQRATLFRVAFDLSRDLDFQYVLTINEDQIESAKQFLSAEEYSRLHSKEIVRLELTDDAPTEKLLGHQVDLEYVADDND